MPLPVITDTWRVAFEWERPGTQATNVMHFRSSATDASDVFADIAAAVDHDQWLLTSNSAVIERLSLTPLDGTNAAYQFLTGGGAEWQGEGGTDFLPNSGALVKLGTTEPGRSGRGRVYLPWIAEGNQDQGTVDATRQADSNVAWGGFLTALSGAAQTVWVVASYTDVAAYDVFTAAVESQIATQRRRFHRH